MKRNTIFSAMTAIVLATVLSGCFGLGTSLGMDYGPGYDDLWYDGYGNNYYGGYYGRITVTARGFLRLLRDLPIIISRSLSRR